LLGQRLGSAQATKRYARSETAHAETGDKRATGSRRTGRVREKQRGPRWKIGLPGESEERGKFLFFFFLFKYFKAFSNDFKS
jgi:hypothetical protein